MRRGMMSFAAACLMMCASLAEAQIVIDRVLVRFGAETITQLDVRQARMLKLVDVSADSDQAYVDALVNRRLILAELRRNPPPDPAAGDVEARRQAWPQRVGAGSNLDDLLTRAGMTDAGLRNWIRDELRIQAYVANRFGDRTAERDSWMAMLRQRAGLK
jgi:hypothetical protein